MSSHITCNVLVILLLWITSTVCSDLQSRSYAVKDNHGIPGRWTRVGPAPTQHSVQLQIGLRQGNFSGMERRLYEGK
jgi:tripeptidyl-peptidase-1